MGRRELTPEQERALAAESEARRDDAEEWDFGRPATIDRGRRPTAVLSVRVPLSQVRELRRIAGQQRLSLSRLLQDAVECYIATPRAVQLRFAEVQRFLAFNVEPERTGTDVRTPSSPFSGGPPATLTSAQWRQMRAAG